MIKRFSVKETNKIIDKIIENDEILFKAEIVNKRGKALDSDLSYSEIIAKRLLTKHHYIEHLKSQRKHINGTPYGIASHDGTSLNPTLFGLVEQQRVSIALYNRKNLGSLGVAIDYLVPIYHTEMNEELGVIDLVSYNKELSTLYVTNYLYNDEKKTTLLQSSLEIITLKEVINEGAFVAAYLPYIKAIDEEVAFDEIKIVPSLLFFEGSYQDRALTRLHETPHVVDIIESTGIIISILATHLMIIDDIEFTDPTSLSPYRPQIHYEPTIQQREINIEDL
ncbi:MAG: hypothetical protein EOM67_07515 [Spirochaetia bacterium]|nr:hypothetical protein [Spirochaetia bacterium]